MLSSWSLWRRCPGEDIPHGGITEIDPGRREQRDKFIIVKIWGQHFDLFKDREHLYIHRDSNNQIIKYYLKYLF